MKEKTVFWQGKQVCPIKLFNTSIKDDNKLAIKYLIKRDFLNLKKLYEKKHLIELALEHNQHNNHCLDFLIEETGIEFILKNKKIVEKILKSNNIKLIIKLIDNDINIFSQINSKQIISFILEKNFLLFKKIIEKNENILNKINISELLENFLLNHKNFNVEINKIEYLINISNKEINFNKNIILEILKEKLFLKTINKDIFLFINKRFNFNFNFLEENIIDVISKSKYKKEDKDFILETIYKHNEINLFNNNIEKTNLNFLLTVSEGHFEKILYLSKKTDINLSYLFYFLFKTNNKTKYSHKYFIFLIKENKLLHIFKMFLLLINIDEEYNKILMFLKIIDKKIETENIFNILLKNINIEKDINTILLAEFIKRSDEKEKHINNIKKYLNEKIKEEKIPHLYLFKYNSEYNKMKRKKMFYKKIDIVEKYNNIVYLKEMLNYLER